MYICPSAKPNLITRISLKQKNKKNTLPKVSMLGPCPYRDYVFVKNDMSANNKSVKIPVDTQTLFSALYFAFCMFIGYQCQPTTYQVDFSAISHEQK